MNENINLTKILKDCPKGWEFYSSNYGIVKFYRFLKGTDYPISFSFIDGHNIERCSCVTEQGLSDYYCNGECTLFPSKEQRDWSKFTAPWYNNEKFDPKTLQPFYKVLVRDSDSHQWKCDLFSNIIENGSYRYKCVGSSYKYCIPYNEDTKHLVGITDEAPEYYSGRIE